MLVPVSLSGTGNTFSALMRSALADSHVAADSSAARKSAPVARVRSRAAVGVVISRPPMLAYPQLRSREHLGSELHIRVEPLFAVWQRCGLRPQRQSLEPKDQPTLAAQHSADLRAGQWRGAPDLRLHAVHPHDPRAGDGNLT